MLKKTTHKKKKNINQKMTKPTNQKKQVTDQNIFNVVQMHLQTLVILTKVSQERLKINLGDTRDKIL